MRVVFVALSFHLNNTRSSHFLIDILEKVFDDFHVVSDGDAWFEIPRLKPEILIIFQKIYSPEELECFGAKNIVLIPMYDACPHTEEFWNLYRPYKIFCFSRTLYDFLDGRSFQAYFAQYYSKPLVEPHSENHGIHAFYWERSNLVNWSCIRKLLGDIAIDSFHYHRSSNIRAANYDTPSPGDIKDYKISFSDWFETQEEYSDIIEKCTLYFAPRESEGIGHSFIEALSRGLCVVAPDAPTMNEYITNGINGILYDPHLPSQISLSNIGEIRERARALAKKGHAQWLASIPAIIDFIKKPLPGYSPKQHPWIYALRHGRAIVRNLYKKMERKSK
jgi:glycosyltransferase involved in cell wall biosynthesis